TYVTYNSTTSTATYTIHLHDALPIYRWEPNPPDTPTPPPPPSPAACLERGCTPRTAGAARCCRPLPDQTRRSPPRSGSGEAAPPDRKSTRLNSSHVKISYAVFCLKKK